MDSSTDTKKILLVRQSLPKKKLFLRGDFKPFMSKRFQIWDHFFPLLFPKDSESLKILDIRLQEVGANRRLNGVNKWKNTKKNFLRRGKSFQIWDHFFPLLFPKNSEYQTFLDICLREVGAKRPVNGVRNIDTKISCSVRQNLPKKQFFLRGNFKPFISKKFQIWHHFFPLLFPKNS